MPSHRPLRLAALAVALVALLVPAGAAGASPWPTACGQHPAHVAAMAAPCSEIDRAVHEAAVESGIDEARFRRSISCESHFIDVAQNGQFIGLSQLGRSFVPGYVRPFDDAHAVDLGQGMPGYAGTGTGFDTRNPFHNARLAAWVISWDGYGQWSCRG